jgi:hypothetical protein
MSLVQIQGNASGTGTLTIAAPNTNTNRTLTLPDGTGTFSVAGVNSNIVAGTAVASTSGTSIDFTGIPTWVKRITVMFNGVSTNGTNPYLIQIGAGSVTTTGYAGNVVTAQGGTTSAASFSTSGGFPVVYANAAAYVYSGSAVLTNISGNAWAQAGIMVDSTGVRASITGGSVTLSGTLDRVRITTSTGVDTFDLGTINILYE